MTTTHPKARLPYEVRLEILRLIDEGLKPEEVSRRLYVPLVGVHKALAWRRHRDAHQHANRNLPQPQRGNGAEKFPRCTVLKTACGKCEQCQQFINENLHAVETSESGSANIHHDNCCPQHGAETQISGGSDAQIQHQTQQ